MVKSEIDRDWSAVRLTFASTLSQAWFVKAMYRATKGKTKSTSATPSSEHWDTREPAGTCLLHQVANSRSAQTMRLSLLHLMLAQSVVRLQEAENEPQDSLNDTLNTTADTTFDTTVDTTTQD